MASSLRAGLEPADRGGAGRARDLPYEVEGVVGIGPGFSVGNTTAVVPGGSRLRLRSRTLPASGARLLPDRRPIARRLASHPVASTIWRDAGVGLGRSARSGAGEHLVEAGAGSRAARRGLSRPSFTLGSRRDSARRAASVRWAARVQPTARRALRPLSDALGRKRNAVPVALRYPPRPRCLVVRESHGGGPLMRPTLFMLPTMVATLLALAPTA